MSLYNITEHKIPCQHIREYPKAVSATQEDVLHLAVKQYVPKDNLVPQPGDITIIAAHANGFPKELYEPLWDDLHAQAVQQGFRIRGIWMADVAQQGQSGIMNQELLGNDPNWNDHPRDLLHLINLMRDEMPRPFIGIGHSMGGCHIVNLAYLHPRLFTTLILIDPVIQTLSVISPDQGPSPARLSTFRRDLWSSREDAAKGFKASRFYQQWDPRVLERWIEYGLRDVPALLDSTEKNLAQEGKRPVTLTTSIHQEVFTFVRPNYEGYGINGKPVSRKTHADLNPTLPLIFPFYRAEAAQAFFRLPELRPSVLYIFGGKSEVCPPDSCKIKIDLTGVGVGGSGGAPLGRVCSVLLEEHGHLLPMEATGKTAKHTGDWISKEWQLWRKDEAEHRRTWLSRPLREKQTLDDRWRKMIGGPFVRTTKL
ncbi:uncharacterized protein PV07_04830 [Cladophialophora immunda]|uniref:AB hydrolase-1 domain-containing protein n=1 Tax=Cladophialophora immunda TaxID=569365 RepID=A0A0D2CZK8_9EURO|nr:uncharacterized protein PV07_04830 [Cladophialophora immunda]KIW28979.1 hypothetical protein PV07_04830 [Cladophialophora immunda]